MSRARSDVLAVTRIAPIFASANCRTTHSGTLVAHSDDALALLDAERHQAAGDRARLPLERGERVARPLRVDERLVRPGSAAARRVSRSPTVTSR